MIEETTFKWIMAGAIIALVVIAVINGVINATPIDPCGGWTITEPMNGIIW